MFLIIFYLENFLFCNPQNSTVLFCRKGPPHPWISFDTAVLLLFLINDFSYSRYGKAIAAGKLLYGNALVIFGANLSIALFQFFSITR